MSTDINTEANTADREIVISRVFFTASANVTVVRISKRTAPLSSSAPLVKTIFSSGTISVNVAVIG